MESSLDRVSEAFFKPLPIFLFPLYVSVRHGSLVTNIKPCVPSVVADSMRRLFWNSDKSPQTKDAWRGCLVNHVGGSGGGGGGGGGDTVPFGPASKHRGTRRRISTDEGSPPYELVHFPYFGRTRLLPDSRATCMLGAKPAHRPIGAGGYGSPQRPTNSAVCPLTMPFSPSPPRVAAQQRPSMHTGCEYHHATGTLVTMSRAN